MELFSQIKVMFLCVPWDELINTVDVCSEMSGQKMLVELVSTTDSTEETGLHSVCVVSMMIVATFTTRKTFFKSVASDVRFVADKKLALLSSGHHVPMFGGAKLSAHL